MNTKVETTLIKLTKLTLFITTVSFKETAIMNLASPRS